MKLKTYYCEGYDPLFGPIEDLMEASSIEDAKAKFQHLHGIVALYVSVHK
jgi:hypothetical protein